MKKCFLSVFACFTVLSSISGQDQKGGISESMLNYQTHIDNGSMFNTPPVVPIYSALLTLRWVKAQGGVKEMERRAVEKADLLYTEIDRNKLFVGTAAEEDRSRMMN